MKKKWLRKRERLFEIVEVGASLDLLSRLYDIINASAIFLNLGVSILYTFSEIRDRYETVILVIEGITITIFSDKYKWNIRSVHGTIGSEIL